MTALSVWLEAAPGLASMLLLGSGLTLLLWREPERISLAEWLGWSWLAGTGAGSMLLGGLGLLLRGPWLFGAMVALALGAAGAGWRWRSGTPQGWPVAGAAWEKALALLPLALLGLALALALRETLLADGLFLVEFKARAAWQNDGQMPALLFRDPSRVLTHPSYPLLVPLAELWLYLGAGAADQPLAKLLFAPFYGAGVLLIFGFVARCTGRLWAGALAALLTAGVPALLASSFTLQYGYPDYPLSVLLLAAVTALLLPKAQLPLAALAAGLLPWAKAEGVLLWALSSAAAALWLRRRAAWWVAAPGAAVWLAWQGLLRLLHAPAEHVFAPLSRESLAIAGQRCWPVLNYFGHELTNRSTWGLLWWSVPLAVLAGWRSPQRSRILLASGLAAGALALDLLPYLFTRLDLAFHLQTSCDRLVLQSAWVALLPLALVLGGRRSPAP